MAYPTMSSLIEVACDCQSASIECTCPYAHADSYSRHSYCVDYPIALVGTHPGAHVTVSAEARVKKMNQVHALLAGAHVADLGSANGTYVCTQAFMNKWSRLSPFKVYQLVPGQRISFGGVPTKSVANVDATLFKPHVYEYARCDAGAQIEPCAPSPGARCCVCLNTVQTTSCEHSTQLGCGHVFHTECVAKWFASIMSRINNTSQTNPDIAVLMKALTCPMCRQAIHRD
jgi:hypothetical protein